MQKNIKKGSPQIRAYSNVVDCISPPNIVSIFKQIDISMKNLQLIRFNPRLAHDKVGTYTTTRNVSRDGNAQREISEKLKREAEADLFHNKNIQGSMLKRDNSLRQAGRVAQEGVGIVKVVKEVGPHHYDDNTGSSSPKKNIFRAPDNNQIIDHSQIFKKKPEIDTFSQITQALKNQSTKNQYLKVSSKNTPKRAKCANSPVVYSKIKADGMSIFSITQPKANKVQDVQQSPILLKAVEHDQANGNLIIEQISDERLNKIQDSPKKRLDLPIGLGKFKLPEISIRIERDSHLSSQTNNYEYTSEKTNTEQTRGSAVPQNRFKVAFNNESPDAFRRIHSKQQPQKEQQKQDNTMIPSPDGATAQYVPLYSKQSSTAKNCKQSQQQTPQAGRGFLSDVHVHEEQLIRRKVQRERTHNICISQKRDANHVSSFSQARHSSQPLSNDYKCLRQLLKNVESQKLRELSNLFHEPKQQILDLTQQMTINTQNNQFNAFKSSSLATPKQRRGMQSSCCKSINNTSQRQDGQKSAIKSQFKKSLFQNDLEQNNQNKQSEMNLTGYKLSPWDMHNNNKGQVEINSFQQNKENGAEQKNDYAQSSFTSLMLEDDLLNQESEQFFFKEASEQIFEFNQQ